MPCPQQPVGLQPLVQRAQWVRVESVDALLRDRTPGHEARVAEHPEVLGDRRLAHRQGRDEFVDAAVRSPEFVEDPTSGRLGEHGEGGGGHAR